MADCPPGYRKNAQGVCVPVSSGKSKDQKTESDVIYDQMTPEEQDKAWTLFSDVVSGRVSGSEAARRQAANEARVRAGAPVEEPVPEALSAQASAAVFQGLANFLQSIGLGSLFSYVGNKPSGWLWEQIKSGVETEDQLLFALEQTPEFQQRFKVIFDMRAANSPYVPTVSQVLEYEQDFFQLMNSSGVPSWFFDSTDDAQKAMSKGLAITQVEARLQRGFQMMQRMPSEVRDVFSEYYGESADSAMLAAILDPEKTLNEIDRAVRVGQIGGFGRRAGFEINRTLAERFGEVPMTEAEIQAGIQTAAGLRPLTQENFGERVDLTEIGALQAGLAQSATDLAAFENRLRTRQLQQANIGGGATISTQGVLGAGVV